MMGNWEAEGGVGAPSAIGNVTELPRGPYVEVSTGGSEAARKKNHASFSKELVRAFI